MGQKIGLQVGCGLLGIFLVVGLQTLLRAAPALPHRIVSVSLALVNEASKEKATVSATPAAISATPVKVTPAQFPGPTPAPTLPPAKVGSSSPRPIATPAISPMQSIESFQPPAVTPLRDVDLSLPLPDARPAVVTPAEPESTSAQNGLLLRVLIDSKKNVLQVKVIRGVGNPFLEDALAREMIGKPLAIADTLVDGETAWVELLVAMRGGGLVP